MSDEVKLSWSRDYQAELLEAYQEIHALQIEIIRLMKEIRTKDELVRTLAGQLEEMGPKDGKGLTDGE